MKDFIWLVSRICDGKCDIVPGWTAMNKATTIVDLTITTAGMLPILQAPADDDDRYYHNSGQSLHGYFKGHTWNRNTPL